MALPGFRDFYPDDCAARNAIFAKWRDVARRYGFVEYDGPPLEPLDLFTKKSGQEIAGQLYNFVDKGDREVALRPEMTPTLARLVTARHKDFKKPLKWFSIPQVFRYERQQRGRLREHYQFNCDIIGEAGLEADVELIALVIDTLRAFGLTEKDFVVRLSDRQFWTEYMDELSMPESQRYAFIQAIDKSERESREKTEERIREILIDQAAERLVSNLIGQEGSFSTEDIQRAAHILASKLTAILEDASLRASARLDTVETGLRHRGLQDYVKRDYTVVRGLAYYTGVVFEVFDRSGEFRAIAGGGRYDSLLKNLGDVDLPALGFGMGDVVLGEILKARQWKHHVGGIDLFIGIKEGSSEYQEELARFIQKCRENGFKVDYALKPGSWKRQQEMAENARAKYFCVIGEGFMARKVQCRLLDRNVSVGDKSFDEIFDDMIKSRSGVDFASGRPSS
jgi:histidyl-tRNA synthetase